MSSARSITPALLALLACDRSTTTFDDAELDEGSRLVVIVLDTTRVPRSWSLLGPESGPGKIALAEGESLVRARLELDHFVTPLGAPLPAELAAGLAVDASPGPKPLRSPLRCGLDRAPAPIVVHPGDLCPLPPAVVLAQEVNRGGTLVASPLTAAEETQLRELVRLDWPGESTCGTPTDVTQLSRFDLEIADDGAQAGLPRRALNAEAVGHTTSGLVAFAAEGRAGVIAPGRPAASRAVDAEVSSLIGLPGDRFALASSGDAPAIEVIDAEARALGRVELAAPALEYLRLQHFPAQDVLLAIGRDAGAVLHLFTCDTAPLACAPLLALDGVFEPFSDETGFVTASGVLVLSSNASARLSLERLPRQAELLGPTTASVPTGTIATTSGPIAWRADRWTILDEDGAELGTGALRTGVLGDVAIACADSGSGRYVVASATVTPGFITGAGPSPVLRVSGPSLPRLCRPAPVAPGAASLRIDVTSGSWLEVDGALRRLACGGEGCDPPEAAPLRTDIVVRVRSQVPGWVLAIPDRGAIIHLRDEREPDFVDVYDVRLDWYGALAARGREVWAFQTGTGDADDTALAAGDPPIHVARVLAAGEVPIEAAYDPAADDFVLIGDSRAIDRPFIRRVSPDGATTEVAVPAIDGWLVSAGELAPGRIAIATSDARLFLLEGTAIREVPIVQWDDVSTPAITELAPTECFSSGQHFPPDRAPSFTSVRGGNGTAFISGCSMFLMRVVLHGDEPFPEVVGTFTGPLPFLDDLDRVLPVCPNRVFAASDTKLYELAADYEAGPDARTYARGLDYTQVDGSGHRIVEVLPSPRGPIVLRGGSNVGTIELGGLSAQTFHTTRFIGGTVTSEGVVAIATDEGELLIARRVDL